jgi:hypothetical protein
MKIIQITEPFIYRDGEKVYTNSYMFRSLNDFQRDIDRMERKGATACYFHSLWTQHEKDYTVGGLKEDGNPEIIYNDNEVIIYWVSCKYIKE